MRSGAQIHEIPLGIEGDFSVFRQILDQFHFVGLVFFLHESDGFLSGQRKPFDLRALFDHLFHLFFDFIQIFSGKGLTVKIVIKTGVDGRADGQFCLRIQPFDRLCQHVGGGVAQRRQPFFV